MVTLLFSLMLAALFVISALAGTVSDATFYRCGEWMALAVGVILWTADGLESAGSWSALAEDTIGQTFSYEFPIEWGSDGNVGGWNAASAITGSWTAYTKEVDL